MEVSLTRLKKDFLGVGCRGWQEHYTSSGKSNIVVGWSIAPAK